MSEKLRVMVVGPVDFDLSPHFEIVSTAADAVVADTAESLESLRTARGRACEVGGLPVLLPSRPASVNPDNPDQGFGSLEFIPTPLQSLVERTSNAAHSFRERSEAASDHLAIVVVSMAMLIVGLLALATVLYAATPHDDAAAKAREAAAYEDYRRRFGWSQPGPAECRSEAEFADLDAALAGPLAPPAEYAKAWRDTPAVTLHRKWLADAAIARQQRQLMAAWYRDQSRHGSELLDAPRYVLAAAVWLLQEPPLWPRTGNVPESIKLPQRRGAPLTFDSIHASDLVEQAASEWAATSRRFLGLPQLQTLARHLGLWPRWP